MKKMLFVFNPNSGKARIKNHLIEILHIFNDAGFEVAVYPTKASNDGYNHIVFTEGRYDIIVCSGGDGTLNETVGAILQFKGKRPPIGYIPSGSTNDFATSLGIPSNMKEAARLIAEGKVFPCDIGIVNGRRSFNYIAAFGAFTSVSYDTPQNLKNMFGHQAYIMQAVTDLASFKPQYMRVYCDEMTTEGNYIFGMISNSDSVGGLKGLTGAGVDLCDGLFEVTLIRELTNPIAIQSVVNAFITKDFSKCEWIDVCKTKSIRFESAVDVSWTLDGEFGGNYKEVQFDVMNKAVEFII